MNEELTIIESTDNLFVLQQLPIIEQNLKSFKPQIKAAVEEALALDVTEGTVKQVKKVRADLNSKKQTIDAQRMKLKLALSAPYDAFMQVYAECVTNPLTDADHTLRDRINEVEQKLKDEKSANVNRYFIEYALSKGLAWLLTFEQTGIRVGLSDTETALKKKAAEFVDDVAQGISTIMTMEHADEIMVEYKSNGFSVVKAISVVNQRHAALEIERQRKEAAELANAQQAQTVEKVEQVIASCAPIVEAVPVVEEEKLTATFTVTDTLARLQALKKFMNDGGYDYE